MKIHKPTDTFLFGKYEGEKLDFVFTFHPEYIEWLILNLDSFAIDIELFQVLHVCPFAQMNGADTKYFNLITVFINGEYRHCTLREYLTDFMDLYKNHYLNTPERKTLHKFSDRVITKNNQNSIYCLYATKG